MILVAHLRLRCCFIWFQSWLLSLFSVNPLTSPLYGITAGSLASLVEAVKMIVAAAIAITAA